MGKRKPESKPGVDRIFHALGDPMRRAMVERLRARPHSVSALAEPLRITLTAVGQHLKVLEEAGLVRTEKLGRVRSVRLEAEGFAVLEAWAAEHRGSGRCGWIGWGICWGERVGLDAGKKKIYRKGAKVLAARANASSTQRGIAFLTHGSGSNRGSLAAQEDDLSRAKFLA